MILLGPAQEWNSLVAELVQLIWVEEAARQAGRWIMVGTSPWGSMPGIATLDPPPFCNPTNTIISVHCYEPFHFTHQGADWVGDSADWIGTSWIGSTREQANLLELFDLVTKWNELSGRGFEIHMGEFGVYSKHVDPAQQKAWTAFIAREAEKRHMSWAYWEFSAGFGAYDPLSGVWRSYLLDALIPVSDRPSP